MSAPERIFINPDDAFVEHTTWCTLSYGDVNVEYVRADLSPSREGIAVKPLVWSEAEHCPEGREYHSLTLVGAYYIGFGSTKGKRCVEYNGNALADENGVIWFDYLKDAKAAAQADYERRILSALTPGNTDPIAEWQSMDSAPKDGRKFDVWCVNPENPDGQGVRLTDVQMRGDKSGFGFVIHLPNKGVAWQYLDAREPDSVFPAWTPTHWMPLPPASGEQSDNPVAEAARALLENLPDCELNWTDAKIAAVKAYLKRSSVVEPVSLMVAVKAALRALSESE